MFFFSWERMAALFGFRKLSACTGIFLAAALAGSHNWLTALFCLKAPFGFHQHLARSFFWLAAAFGWYSFFLAATFDS